MKTKATIQMLHKATDVITYNLIMAVKHAVALVAAVIIKQTFKSIFFYIILPGLIQITLRAVAADRFIIYVPVATRPPLTDTFHFHVNG